MGPRLRESLYPHAELGVYPLARPQATSRHILVACHNVSAAVSRGLYSPNNLLEGRVDVLARCVAAALYVSNGLRRDTTLWLCLGNATVEVGGAHVIGLNPDEKTAALFLQRALSADGEAVARPAAASHLSGKSQRNLDKRQTWFEARRLENALPPPPGFTVRRGETFRDRLAALAAARYVVLHETGADAWKAPSNSDRVDGEKALVVVVVADQLGWTPAEDAFFAADERASLVSFGPTSMLTSHCIALAHHYIDRGLLK